MVTEKVTSLFLTNTQGMSLNMGAALDKIDPEILSDVASVDEYTIVSDKILHPDVYVIKILTASMLEPLGIGTYESIMLTMSADVFADRCGYCGNFVLGPYSGHTYCSRH